MTGGGRHLLVSPLRPDLRPDLDWLEAALRAGLEGSPGGGGGGAARPVKVVTVVNPANPTGVLWTRDELDRAAALAGAAGAWLLVDNTYKDFVFEGEHYCPAGAHVVHLFSLSKAFGMMG